MIRAARFDRAVLLVLAALPAAAQSLRLGYRTEPTWLDPHYHNATPNIQVAFNPSGPLKPAAGRHPAR